MAPGSDELGPVGREAVLDLLVGAFLHDPMQAWLFPALDTRGVRLRRFYDLDIEHRLAAGTELDHRPGVAAAFWQPPGDAPLEVATALRLAPAFVPVVRHHPIKALLVLRGVLAQRPREPHWYLSHLAVHPDHQGRGIGRSMVLAGLDRAVADGLGVYLETANADNLSFYRSCGFSEVGMIRVTGAPSVWCLWWPPTGPSSETMAPGPWQ